jgi:streptomycin 6-kinase
MELPPALVRNATGVWGDDGARWLAALPALAAAVARDWKLDLGPPYVLSFHWVAPATRADGTPAVLKLGPTGPGHLAGEAAALAAFDGRGAVRLLAHDHDRGALLLERAEPGTMVRDLVPARDERATDALTAVIRRLHVPPPPGCPLPALADLSHDFTAHLRRYRGDDPLPRRMVEHADRLLTDLCASAPTTVVLHGDLHHDNVLASTREPWLAIDPHGYVGDPGFEVGAGLYNPDPDLRDDALTALVPARLERFADGLGMPLERLTAWGFVMAVLSEVWNNDRGPVPPGRAYDVARLLMPRRERSA